MSIPMVEGQIRAIPRINQYGGDDGWSSLDSEIALPHESRSIGRALAAAFTPMDQVVVMRKSDYEALAERLRYTEKCLGMEKPWLTR